MVYLRAANLFTGFPGAQGSGGLWYVPGIGLFGISPGAQKMGQISNSNVERTARFRTDLKGVSQVPHSALALRRMLHLH